MKDFKYPTKQIQSLKSFENNIPIQNPQSTEHQSTIVARVTKGKFDWSLVQLTMYTPHMLGVGTSGGIWQQQQQVSTLNETHGHVVKKLMFK